jgi:hypothetical protein
MIRANGCANGTEESPFAECQGGCHVSAEPLRELSAFTSGQTVGQLLVNLGSADRHIARGVETQLHTISVNLQHHDFNVFPDKHSLAGFSAKN